MTEEEGPGGEPATPALPSADPETADGSAPAEPASPEPPTPGPEPTLPPPPSFGPPPPPVFGARGPIGSFGVQAVLPAPLPPPTAEALAIPLGPRKLVGMSLDLLTRSDSGLRAASFYIGFMLLLTVGPAVALFGLALATGNGDALGGTGVTEPYGGTPAWAVWLVISLIPAFLGVLAVSVEAKALATAVIGGRAEGRPLRLRASIAVARARFWSMLWAGVLVGVLSTIVRLGALWVLSMALQRSEAIDALDYVISVVVGVVVGTPFIYAPAGIILGEAGAATALRRSIRLARARKQLAVVVTLFSVLAGLVVQFGLGVAADTVVRVLSGTGLTDHFPPALVVPLAAALVFAYGTLVLLTEAIGAAPAVHAFVALTHYTGGLERGRREPIAVRHVWDPWLTTGLAATAALAIASLLFGLLALPWTPPV